MVRTSSRRTVRLTLITLAALSLAGSVVALNARQAAGAFGHNPSGFSTSDSWADPSTAAESEDPAPPPPSSPARPTEHSPIVSRPAGGTGSSERSPVLGAPHQDGGPLPFKQAMAAHRANGFELVTDVPAGYIPAAMASANAGSIQGLSEFRWADAEQHEFVFSTVVKPASRTDHVLVLGPGAMTGHSVQDHPAEYLQDDGMGFARLVWYDGAVEYEISTNDASLLLGDLLRTAESAR